MRLRLLVLLLACGCGGSTPPSTTPVVVSIPAADPVPTASAAPSSSAVATAQELEKLDAEIRKAQEGAARTGDVPIGMLDSAAVAGGVGGLRLGGGGGGTIQPGAPGGLAGIGSGGTVKGPIGQAAIGSPSVKGTVSNAQAVVAGMAAGFRRCFNKGLAQDPSMQGSVTITATLGPQGEVFSVKPSGGKGLSGSVVSCVAARVSSAQFMPPNGGSATITIPVTFTAVQP